MEKDWPVRFERLLVWDLLKLRPIAQVNDSFMVEECDMVVSQRTMFAV